MSFKLSIGKTTITSEDMYTNEAIMAFIDKGIYPVDPNYLYHLCCGTDWTAGTNKAVMGLTLNKSTLSEKMINLPSVDEQNKIAGKLDAVDALINLRQRELTKQRAPLRVPFAIEIDYLQHLSFCYFRSF